MKLFPKTNKTLRYGNTLIVAVICLSVCALPHATIAQQDETSEAISSRRNSPQIITFEQMQLEEQAKRQREIERQQAIEQQQFEEKQLELRRQIEQERIEHQQAEAARSRDQERQLEQLRVRQEAEYAAQSKPGEPKRLIVPADQATLLPHSSVEPRIRPVQYQSSARSKPVLDGHKDSDTQARQEVDSKTVLPANSLPTPSVNTAITLTTQNNPATPELPNSSRSIDLKPFLPTPKTPLPKQWSVANEKPENAIASESSSSRRSQTDGSSGTGGVPVSQTPAPISVYPDAMPESSKAEVLAESNKQTLPTRPGQQSRVSRSEVEDIEVVSNNGLVTIIARDALLSDILNVLSENKGLNFVHSMSITDRISIALRNIPLENALTAVLSTSGYNWTENNGIIYVTSLFDSTPMIPEASGREVRVFRLDYADPGEVSQVVSGMISNVGKSFITKSDPRDGGRSKELIVVEDLPDLLDRIEQYIQLVDVPPRQVLIEAYVLQVDLRENQQQANNLENLAKYGTKPGDTYTGNSAKYVSFHGQDMSALIDELKTKTNATTLAAPKLLAINGRESRLQIGQQLGFRTATTTQNSTTEEVHFLDVGVSLSITPRISGDGRIMLKLQPKVSSGEVNPRTGLPEGEMSEFKTSVLLDNGSGMVIGGLIQEAQGVVQNKVLVNQNNKGRKEIIFVLLPRIVDNNLKMNNLNTDNVEKEIADQQAAQANYAREAHSGNVVPLSREFQQAIKAQSVLPTQPVAVQPLNPQSSAQHRPTLYPKSSQNIQAPQRQAAYHQPAWLVWGQRTRERKVATDQQQQSRQQQVQFQQYQLEKQQQLIRQRAAQQQQRSAKLQSATQHQAGQPSSRSIVPQSNRTQFNLQRYSR